MAPHQWELFMSSDGVNGTSYTTPSRHDREYLMQSGQALGYAAVGVVLSLALGRLPACSGGPERLLSTKQRAEQITRFAESIRIGFPMAAIVVLDHRIE